ncbi:MULTISPECIES: hypothetical protein, partial [unclassified Burkholderia]|uniref:hypothetical protein n=1 Tax=unclassified Burkholderia TaxID=2613784 RepID=UPI002AB021F6
PSSAHTYRLLIFKEHFCEDPEAFSAALRFQQQRSGDYEPSFSVRQQLFNYFVATAGVQLPAPPRPLRPARQHRFPSSPAPRFR